MTKTETLQQARDLAKPGEWIMTLPMGYKNPLWAIMTEQERNSFTYQHWVTWERA